MRKVTVLVFECCGNTVEMEPGETAQVVGQICLACDTNDPDTHTETRHRL